MQLYKSHIDTLLFTQNCKRLKSHSTPLKGPKDNTLDDFWTMIWQEKVTQIVMLTNIKEGVKVSNKLY